MVIQSIICIVHSTQFTIFCISITFDFAFVLNYTSYITLQYITLREVYFIVLALVCIYVYFFLGICMSFSLYTYYSNIIISLYHIIEVLIRTPFSSCILYLLYIIFMQGYTTPTRI